MERDGDRMTRCAALWRCTEDKTVSLSLCLMQTFQSSLLFLIVYFFIYIIHVIDIDYTKCLYLLIVSKYFL